MTDWLKFPKTEMHLHLEGAAPVDFIQAQAKKKNIDLSHVIDGKNYLWKDFDAFLKTYEAVMSVLTTPQDFADLMRAVLAQSAGQGVKYTEIFLGPVLMSDNDPVRWKEMLAAIEEASSEAEEKYDLIVRYISVIVRHFGIEKAEETAKLTAQISSPRLTGFGMAGAEDFGRPNDFSRAFKIAGDAGLGLTVHAGEWCDPPSIREAIDSLGVTRLGHGVRAVEDLDLIKYIIDKDIHLEVCPGSNVSLGASQNWKNHQIHELKNMGVSISISTDDPPYFATDMENEYTQLANLGWSAEDFKRTNLEAIRHAFVDEEIKARISEKLEY